MKIVIIKKRKPTRKQATRVDMILMNHYGNRIGTGQTDACLCELIRDVKYFCKITGRKFENLL